MDDMTARVRGILKRLSQERRFSQTAVAARLNLVPSAVNRTLNQPDRPLTLEFLEVVADASGVPIVELIAPPGSLVKQLDADEAALLRHLRSWPKSVTHALIAFVGYFADEPPIERQARNLHEMWRGLGVKDRDWLEGVVRLVREGFLPPDLRAGFEQKLQAEANSRTAQPKGRRREET